MNLAEHLMILLRNNPHFGNEIIDSITITGYYPKLMITTTDGTKYQVSVDPWYDEDD